MADETRNLNPHAEARLAMALWSREYAYEQRGGSMDFWDSLNPSRKRIFVEIVDGIMKAVAENGRASDSPTLQGIGRIQMTETDGRLRLTGDGMELVLDSRP